MIAAGMTAVNLFAATERDHAIDAEHLHRMTLGDRRLEREVLELFVRQTAIMLDRIAAAEQPANAAAAAHTLKGSARGIGAWRVARAAEMVEQAAGAADGEEIEEANAELRAASLEASVAIGARLTVLLAELAKDR
ncbi:MAG TPA: Hpt domain-containing protein [Xanthobacteraceae bacterium]|nr:Hpt domain-containing protein [Xanthobacteraceae bacterium]